MKYDEYDVAEKLQEELDKALNEIKKYGKDSLYIKGEKVLCGRIVIEFDNDCNATVTYEKTAFPEKVK